MKLIDLFENVETDNVALAKKIKRDCEFYFSQVKNPSLHLYRGSESENMVHGAFRKFKARTRPLDTPLKFHTELNRYFKVMYGRPFRNGLFVTGSVDVAEQYGNAFIIMPKGEFEWLSSPDIQDVAVHLDPETYEDNDDPNAPAEALETLKDAQWFESMKLEQCIESGNEIMLWCPKGYYVLDPNNLPKEIFG